MNKRVSKRVIFYLKSFAVVGILFSFILFGSEQASAHAQLVATYPIDNSVVTDAPKVIVLSWGEEVKAKASQFSLTASNGRSEKFVFAYHFDASTGEGTATLTPARILAKGSYIVSWKVISHDGHLVAGSTTFGINVTAVGLKSSNSTSYLDEVLQSLFWVLVILIFGAIFAARKGLYFLAVRLLMLVALARLASSYIILKESFLSTGSSQISIFALLILGLILLVPRIEFIPVKFSKIHQLILLSVLFVSQPFFEGHPLDLVKPSYLKYISAGHLLFALLWTGSVVALFLRQTKEQYVLTRKISTFSILLLVGLGGTLTYFLALPLNFASKSAWESFIVVKLALVLTALFIGAYHHFVGKKIIDSLDFSLRKSLLIESVTIVSIVVTTALLVSYTPPKIIANQYKISQRLTLANSGKNYYQFPVKFDNNLSGTFYIQKVGNGQPSMLMLAVNSKKTLKSPAVDVYFSNSGLNIVDLHAKLSGASDQYMSYLSIPAKGRWHVSIQILLDEFTQTQSNFDINI